MLPMMAQMRLSWLEYFLRMAALFPLVSPTLLAAGALSVAAAGAPPPESGANAWRSKKYAANLFAVDGPTIT